MPANREDTHEDIHENLMWKKGNQDSSILIPLNCAALQIVASIPVYFYAQLVIMHY